MLKTILLGGAIAVALPALAQAPTTRAPVNAATPRSPAHDPLQTQDDATVQSTATPSTDAAAQGDVSNTSPGLRAGIAAATDKCTMKMARNSRRAMKGRCARTNAGAVPVSATASASTAASPAYTGMGGPDTGATSYPPCSRTVRDSCIQTARPRR